MQRIILHIDFDSFFASVAQQDNPHLRNRPIGVTATNGRTCIIAASREAKALGIKSPSRTFEAKRICPSIIFVPANFVRYWEISKKFIDICKDYSPFVEIFSLDEVFMDVTQTVGLFGGTHGLIEKIKNRLILEVGEYITASYGISHNKLLAKLASGLEKPNGIVEITKENLWDIYNKTKLTDICGIGGRIEARLNSMGIYSLSDLSKAPLSALIAEFGMAEGEFLSNVGQGIDNSSVIPYTNSIGVKSVGRNYCLPQNEYDLRIVNQNIYELCEEVGLKLRRLHKKAKTIGIYLGGENIVCERKTFINYFDTGKEIFEACLNAIQSSKCKMQSFISDSPTFNFDLLTFNFSYVRQIHIWAGNLEDAVNIPESLFIESKQTKLKETIDNINEKFGDHTIRNGFLLYAPKLITIPNGFMADRYELLKLADKLSLR